jgi:hypothetical protein
MVKSGYSRREYVPVWFFNACNFDAKLWFVGLKNYLMEKTYRNKD